MGNVLRELIEVYIDGSPAMFADMSCVIWFFLSELPASAAEDAISKSEILQHNKPLPSISSGAFHDRRLYSLSSSPYQSDEPMPQNSSPSTSSRQNSSCGPLPPISSISPANHGSPVSCLNNNGDSNDTLSSMTCLQSQLAMYNDYLNQSQTITTSPISPADSHEMDVSSAQDTNMWQNQMDYSQTIPNNNNNICWPEQIIQNNNSNMTDEDLSNWLDNLMQNNNFGQDVMPSLTSENLQQCFGSHEPDNFHLENGQTFLQPDLGYQSMDVTDSFFNAASALDPHMFEMLLDDFHDSTGMSGNNGSNGGFLPSFASLNGGNGSSYLYCSEPEQMLWEKQIKKETGKIFFFGEIWEESSGAKETGWTKCLKGRDSHNGPRQLRGVSFCTVDWIEEGNFVEREELCTVFNLELFFPVYLTREMCACKCWKRLLTPVVFEFYFRDWRHVLLLYKPICCNPQGPLSAWRSIPMEVLSTCRLVRLSDNSLSLYFSTPKNSCKISRFNLLFELFFPLSV